MILRSLKCSGNNDVIHSFPFRARNASITSREPIVEKNDAKLTLFLSTDMSSEAASVVYLLLCLLAATISEIPSGSFYSVSSHGNGMCGFSKNEL